ncbi:MAG TPA: hypothetical protein VES79_03510 [Solirubrobacteraceae bacterium]|nr:hypothetical protein [Solirubrobacteraceae bacterium]
MLLLDADRRPTSAALLGLGMLVALSFVIAFVLGTQAPRASGGTPPRTARAAIGTTGAGPATTPLRLDPVPVLPDLRKKPLRTRSQRPAEAAAPSPAPTTEPVTTPTPAVPTPAVPTPAAPQPAQPPVAPARPAPAAKPKPSSTPAREKFDSSG